MKIETKFDMLQTVYIPAAGYQKARIVVIRLAGKNLAYEVEFWTADGVKSATLYEDELVAEIPESVSGFKP